MMWIGGKRIDASGETASSEADSPGHGSKEENVMPVEAKERQGDVCHRHWFESGLSSSSPEDSVQVTARVQVTRL